MKIQALVIALLSLTTQAGIAAPIVQYDNQWNTGFAVSSTDLLQTSLASTSYAGYFQQEGALGTAAFNNGVFGEQGNQAGYHWYASEAATADGGNSATFHFNGAFNLTSIDSFAGWDAYRGGQQYSVSYASAADPLTFVHLADVYNDTQGWGNVNTHASITGDAGAFIASNVVSLRFQFGGDLTYGYAGYREIDVQGSAVPAEVPEPASIGLMGLGLLGVAALRRKSARK